MQFSKLKKTIEAFLCDALSGRIELQAAVYRHSHDDQARVWITFDKEQIFSAADLSFHIAHYSREQQLKEERQLKSIPYSNNWQEMFNSPELIALWEASNLAEHELVNQNIMSSWHVYQSLLNYPNLSINDALSSKNSFTRAFALFDRRVGKRSLLKMKPFSHPLEEQFYQIRCRAENINS